MPKCFYSLRKDHVDGPPMQFARVGDKVVHRWECDSDDIYKFLVKDCYVEDGHGKRIEVVDPNGCTTDPVLLSDLVYEPNRPTASAESHVFKFADVSLLYFQCQMQICLKMEEGCRALTPPRCTTGEYHGSVDRHRERAKRAINVTVTPDRLKSDELDVRDQISVFDIDEAVDKLLTTQHNRANAAGSMLYEFEQSNGDGVQSVCNSITKSDLLMVVSSLSFLLLILMAILTILLRRTNSMKQIRFF
uniref:ZP domain-containing protein n=1 Tax=Plectus sambesii TaxID=2011161 RepID=A0A914UJK3_9BILA